MPSIIILDVWKNTGFAMLVFLAGLQNIPPDYYESAQLDGANRWQLFRHITLPLITPTLFFNLIIYMIGALQVFDSIIVLTKGGPGDASRSLVMYIYETAFQLFQMGYASAIAITLFVIIMILTLIQFRLGQRWVHYELTVAVRGGSDLTTAMPTHAPRREERLWQPPRSSSISTVRQRAFSLGKLLDSAAILVLGAGRDPDDPAVSVDVLDLAAAHRPSPTSCRRPGCRPSGTSRTTPRSSARRCPSWPSRSTASRSPSLSSSAS